MLQYWIAGLLGTGLLIVFWGLVSALVGFTGYFVPYIYDAETIRPEQDELARAEPA